jgi:hypothetical protein
VVLISTARRRAALAAVAAAAAVTASGALTAPARAEVSTYTCQGGGLGRDIPVTVAITGTLPGSVHVGDSMTLANFQVTATVDSDVVTNVLATLGLERLTGSFGSFPITATAEDRTIHGSHDPGADGRMPIDDVSVAPGQDLTFTSPASGIPVGPFPAEIPGTTTFTAGNFSLSLDADLAGLLRARHIDLECTGSARIAQVDVQVPPTPPAPGDSGTGTGGTGGGGHDNPGGTTGTGGAQAGTGGTGGTAGTAGGTGSGATQGRGTLAATGVSRVVPMTATGGLLVLLGTGLVLSTRRRRTALAGEAGEETEG